MLKKIKNWYGNLGSQSDPLEVEQAKIRVPAVFLLFIIASVSYYSTPYSKEAYIAYSLISIYAILGWSLLAAVAKNKFKPLYRRLFGAWIDIGGATAFMACTADAGVMLVGFCLWVVFGNGFRYGTKYLYHAQILSIAGFLLAANMSEYWLTHKTIGTSLLFMLIVLPLYVAKLINRLQEAIAKEEIERQKAAEANSAKTRFVASMSHEIRTPLNGIIGISTLFKTTPLNPDQKELISTLDSSSKLLLSLLNNVLDFTKIEERKLNIENAPFSLPNIISDTTNLYKAQCHDKKIALISEISDTLNLVVGDAATIHQVLANLVGNALKFTNKGSITISATASNVQNKHAQIKFEVADTGIGIEENKLDKIFESFTQATNDSAQKFAGSGLGLSIAKDMVQAMGGELQVQSTEGLGTRFWFELTLEQKDDLQMDSAAVEAKSNTSSSASIIHAPHKKLKVLVCEDEQTNQKIITRILSMPGHEVSVASSSEEMLDLLEEQTFDLVVTDLNMAGMDGIDALKIYRFTKPTNKTTGFILFTADVTLETKEAAKEAGFDGVLTKPIEALNMFNMIESALKLPENTAASWMASLEANALEINARTDDSPHSATINQALDLDTLAGLEQIGTDDDLFMPRLLKNYLADSLQLIDRINAAIKEKNYGDLSDQCHALKGNSLSVGAIKLAQSADVLGKITANTPAAESKKLMNQLSTDFSNLTLAIEDYLRRPAVAARR